jgi:hypothetical protein
MIVRRNRTVSAEQYVPVVVGGRERVGGAGPGAAADRLFGEPLGVQDALLRSVSDR